MKTDTLKFKVVVGALSLLCLSQHQAVLAMGTDQPIDVQNISEDEFFEIMTHRIKNDAIESIIDLLKAL